MSGDGARVINIMHTNGNGLQNSVRTRFGDKCVTYAEGNVRSCSWPKDG